MAKIEDSQENAATNHFISLPTSDKVFLFDNIADSFLLLYERGVEVYGTFFSFLEIGLKREALCFFAYSESNRKLYLERAFREDISKGAFQLFPLVNKRAMEFKRLNDKLRAAYKKIPKNYHALRLVADFGSLLNSRTTDEVLNCVRGIMRKKDEKNRLLGNGGEVHFPLQAMIAFEVGTLNDDNIKELSGLCKNMLISTRNEHWMSFLNFRQKSADLIHVETVSRETLEHFVKSHLETLVLSLLLRNPMCGFDVIQSIDRRYHTFLSQGTVYPLLYALRRDGLLEVSKSEGSRAKVYSLTKQGEELTRRQVDDFKRAQSFLLESMEFKKVKLGYNGYTPKKLSSIGRHCA